MKRARLLRIFLLGIGQSVLIIASVLVAAWVENLREERQSRELSRTLLGQMLRELQDDVAQLSAQRPSIHEQSAAANRMVEALSNSRVSDDSVKKIIVSLNYYHSLTFHTATYETFKSIGFNLIKNDSVRIRIMQFYETRQQRAADLARISYEQLFYHYVPILHEHFKEFSMDRGAIPVNFETLKHNNKVIEFFRIWRDLQEVEYYDSGLIISDTNNLISVLKQELSNN